MEGRFVVRGLMAALACLLVGSIFAPQEAAAQGRPILVVPFERDNVDDLFFSTLMKRAHQSASGAQGYMSLDPVDNSMEDMLFAVGCAEASAECLQMVAESFSAEVILHGKVWGNERGIYLELHLFDAQLGSEILDQPIQKSFESTEKETLLKMAIGEIQQLFYPFTGELTIASTEPATTIIFDGAEVGNTSNGPVKLTGLKLGEHTVTAQKGEDEVTQIVVVLHDKPESLTLDPSAENKGPVGGKEGPSHTGSYIAFGVGGASLVTGAIFSVLVNAQNSEVDRLAGLDPVPAGEANDALKGGDQLQALQFVFYGIGAVAVGAGAVLYFMEGGEEESSVTGYIAPFVTSDGVGASVGGSF